MRIHCLPRIVFGHVLWPVAILASQLVFWRTTYYCNNASLATIVLNSSSACTWTSLSQRVLTFISARLSVIASTSDSASGDCLQHYKFSIFLAFLSQSVSTSVFGSVSLSVFITINLNVSKAFEKFLDLCQQVSIFLRVVKLVFNSNKIYPLVAGQPVPAFHFCTILLAVFRQVFWTLSLLAF